MGDYFEGLPLFIGGNGIWKLKQDVLLTGLDSEPFPHPPGSILPLYVPSPPLPQLHSLRGKQLKLIQESKQPLSLFLVWQ